MSDVALVLFILGGSTVLAAFGIIAFRLGGKQNSTALMELQIEKLSDEVVRLQILTDEQARKIAHLQVEVANLQNLQVSLFNMARALASQVRALGHEPVSDPERMFEFMKGGGSQ